MPQIFSFFQKINVWIALYIFRDHPDIVENYDPLASTDINDHDSDPTPQNNGDNKHGTRCAGEVAAAAGNQHCGVGVAFKAKIGGVRMLDGAVSDSVEAASLSLNQVDSFFFQIIWNQNFIEKKLIFPFYFHRSSSFYGFCQNKKHKVLWFFFSSFSWYQWVNIL